MDHNQVGSNLILQQFTDGCRLGETMCSISSHFEFPDCGHGHTSLEIQVILLTIQYRTTKVWSQANMKLVSCEPTGLN